MFPKITLFGILCETGCTCCRDKNHWFFGYTTRGEAVAEGWKLHADRHISSQYSSSWDLG